MQIPGLGHVGLSVGNTQRSIEFYRDIMGMEVVLELDISDDRQSRVIGTPGVKCRIVHLKLGDAVLELFEYQQPVGENRARTMPQWDHGLVHIGFEVDDFHERVKHLKSTNVEFLGEPVEFRPGVWVLYFKGPDGEICELRDISKAP